MFEKILKAALLPNFTATPDQPSMAAVLKANPNHGSDGRFVSRGNAKQVVFHGTGVADLIKKEGFRIVETQRGRLLGDGIYLSSSRSESEHYAEQTKGTVLEVDVGDLKVKEFKKSRDYTMFLMKAGDKDLTPESMAKTMKAKGFDAVKVVNTFAVFTPEKLKIVEDAQKAESKWYIVVTKQKAKKLEGLAAVLKANPYHAADGRFTHGGSAHFVSTGKAFEKTLAKQRAALDKAKAAAGKVEYDDVQGIDDVTKKSQAYMKASQKQWDSLTDDQKTAVRGYTGWDETYDEEQYNYEAMNKVVGSARGDHSQLSKDMIDKIKTLDSALAKGSLPGNTMLYKAINLDRNGFKGIHSDSSEHDLMNMIGHTVTDHAYSSTTTSAEIAKNFMYSGRVMLKLRAKQGTKGMWVGGTDKRSAYPGEHEFVLPRNAKYKIDGVERVKIKGKEVLVLTGVVENG